MSPRLSPPKRLVLLAALLAHWSVPAFGATYRSGDEVIVQPHEVVRDDLVVWGTYVRVDGIVKGDLVALGSEIVVEGVVEGDLIAAGKTVYLNGSVGDDARIATYATALGEEARIADDLFSLAYSLETKPGSRIGGTLHAAGRQVLASGQTAEALLARVGAIALEGVVAGDVKVVVGGIRGVTRATLVVDPELEIPEVASGTLVADGAAIGGDLIYQSEREANIAPGARIAGRVVHEEWEGGSPGPISLPRIPESELGSDDPYSEALQRFGVLLAIGLILVLAFPQWSLDRALDVRNEPFLALGWGFGALIFVGVASFVVGLVGLILLIAFASSGLGGLSLSVIFAGFLLQSALFAPFLIALVYVAPVVASLGAGHFVLERISPESARRGLAVAGTGATVYALLRAIPTLGALVGLVGTLVGLGAIALWVREIRSRG